MVLKSRPGKRYSQKFKDEAVQKYINSEMSTRKVAEIYGVGTGTIWRWIAKFAEQNPDNIQLMSKIRAFSNNYEDYGIDKLFPPEIKNDESRNNDIPLSDKDDEINRLREALRHAELRAELYAEMIKVAEAKFKINIKKKLAPSSEQPAREGQEEV